MPDALPQPARRAWLRLAAAVPMRPPHAVEEPRFVERCTRCDACVAACPTGVIVRGSGGFPELDLRDDGCTFCAACLDACATGALDAAQSRPWSWRARVADTCLAARGVVCRSCGDACDAGAIDFGARAQACSAPTIDVDTCTGCGRCVSACPADALSLQAGLADPVAA